MKKFRKWFGKIVLILVIFLILITAFMQTRIFKNLLRNIITDKANQTLMGAEFHLGKIEGNFFSNIVLKDLKLSADSEVLFSLEELRLNYRLLPIIHKKIVIKEIFLNKLFIKAEQKENGRWDIAELLPKAEKPEKELKPFTWKIQLHDFSLQNADFIISMQEDSPFIPAKLRDFTIQLAANYSQEEAQLHLKTLRFATKNPDFTLAQLEFMAEMKEEIAQVSSFELKTKENTIQANAAFDIIKQKPQNFSLEIQPLHLEEFAVFFPDLPIAKLPELFLSVRLEQNKANVNLTITEQNQLFKAEVAADSIFSNPTYQGKIEIEKLNLEEWIADETFDSDINLNLAFTGNGIKPETADVNLDLQLFPTRFQDKRLDNMQLHAKKNDDKLGFQTTAAGSFGSLSMQGNSNSIFSEPDYQITTELKQLNLAHILANDSLQSNINLTFNLQGTGIDPKTLQANLSLQTAPSTFQTFAIDSFIIQLTYDKKQYEIQDFLLSTSLFDYSMDGFGNLLHDNNINYRLQINHLDKLDTWLDYEKIGAKGKLYGTVTGNLDSLNTNTKLKIFDIIYDNLEIEKLDGAFFVEKIKDNIEFDLDLIIDSIDYEEYSVDKVEITAKGNEKRIENLIIAEADSLALKLKNWVELDSLVTIGLEELDFAYENLNVRTKHDASRIILAKNRYIIEDLQLSFAESLFQVNGFVAPESEQDLQISLVDFDISLANRFVDLPAKLAGNLSFEVDIKGMLTNPVVKSSLTINKIKLDDNDFNEVSLETNLAEKKLQTTFEIIRNEREKITGSANLPFAVADSVHIINPDKPLNVSLAVNELDISMFSELTEPIERLNGILDIDFTVQNTLNNPELLGNIKLSKGGLTIPEYGLQYPELRFDISTKNRKITLKELYLKGGDGFLKMQGWAQLEQPLQDGVREFDFSILGKDFLAAGKRELEVLTNMDIVLQGDMNKPTYNGKLSIERARIDLDALPGSQTPQVNVNEPLLVQAMQQNKKTDEVQEKKNKKQLPFLTNLTGGLQVKIPRNTWIKNKDLNVEISGDLEIVKTGKDFEIFGYVSTIRGQYTLYGRKFDLSDGTVTFRGGKEINPLLDISITHIFRDINREKKELEIDLSGEAMQPDIRFFLDSDEITEADAISYLLFGRSSDQITQGERSEVAGQSESSLAKSMIAKQIGGQIASEIGKTLKLDVVEFSGGENWKQASILVGKYITTDLFLSYQKDFTLGQSKEYVPDVISLEYEINKFLSLQATRGDEKMTGVDFYWKFQKK